MAEEGGNNNVFVYMGGDQEVPRDVTHVRVHKSVKIIARWAFSNCTNLVSIEMHNGVEIIEEYAFDECSRLRGIKLSGVRIIEDYAFNDCTVLRDVEFGNKLETIGEWAFSSTNLKKIQLPNVRVIGKAAFYDCKQLTEVEFSKDLERIGRVVFEKCRRLRRIVIPLKNNLIGSDAFHECGDLSTVDLVGGIHRTTSSLLLNDMGDEIDRINQVLPNVNCYQKTNPIRRWIARVLDSIEHYKIEHGALLKEFTTLIELALWKAELDESQDERSLGRDQPAKKVKIDMKAVRQEQRITSGASVVIKNVLPFLKLE